MDSVYSRRKLPGLLDHLLFSPSLTKFLNESRTSNAKNTLREMHGSRGRMVLQISSSMIMLPMSATKRTARFRWFRKGQPEPLLFGNEITNARHLLTLACVIPQKTLTLTLKKRYGSSWTWWTHFISKKQWGEIAQHWWLRNGTSDNHTSQTVMINLAAKLENMIKNVDTWIFGMAIIVR